LQIEGRCCAELEIAHQEKQYHRAAEQKYLKREQQFKQEENSDSFTALAIVPTSPCLK
jgi:hypothetical protein